MEKNDTSTPLDEFLKSFDIKEPNPPIRIGPGRKSIFTSQYFTDRSKYIPAGPRQNCTHVPKHMRKKKNGC